MAGQIEVQVFLHTTLVRFSPDGQKRKFMLQLPEGSTIGDLVTHLEVTHSADILLFGLNGDVADEKSPLKSGDKVHVMMPVSGG